MATIYLAGPIDKVSAESASTWREEAGRILAVEFNHVVCDPNRTWVTNPETRGAHTDRECMAIVHADLAAVSAVDALLVFSDKNTLACGTYIEVGYAYSLNKTIAFFTTGIFPGFVSGLAHFSPHMRCFFNLREACEWLNKSLDWTTNDN